MIRESIVVVAAASLLGCAQSRHHQPPAPAPAGEDTSSADAASGPRRAADDGATTPGALADRPPAPASPGADASTGADAVAGRDVATAGDAAAAPAALAATPPMGWNSYQAWGAAVTEKEVRANAEYLADKMAAVGYRYVVVDWCWSHPSPGTAMVPDLAVGPNGTLTPALAMDANGRLLPAPERFPSAAGGKGFGPLADYVHSKGLKFGIHVMRGIPRQAVQRNLPVLGAAGVGARDVANTADTCPWLNHMYGVDMTKAGAQAYYDSVFAQYAEWGVDFVKVDDISRPYHGPEIQAVRRALDRTGRPVVLSLSPGPAPLAQADALAAVAHMWRISNDFWDSWSDLLAAFDLTAQWARRGRPGAWPDADMLPVGLLSRRGPMGPERASRFTHDEQQTLLTLWSIFRSPLMVGGDLPANDDFTLALLTNPEVIAVDQSSTGGHPLFTRGDDVAWLADAPGGARYLALFNVGTQAHAVQATLAEMGLTGTVAVRDLWARQDVGTTTTAVARPLAPHGAALLRVSSKP